MSADIKREQFKSNAPASVVQNDLYKRWVIVFWIESEVNPDQRVIGQGDLPYIGTNYSYPWPVDEPAASYELIKSYYLMGAFDYWPPSWQSFWTELRSDRLWDGYTDSYQRHVARVQGPYIVTMNSPSISHVSALAVSVKDKARVTAVGQLAKNKAALVALLDYFKPYKVSEDA